jgi:hypothetical protein
MRVLWVAAAAALAAPFWLAATPAAAGHCCRSVLYGVPQGPPSPYYLADQASPFYLVNQGPVYSGPGIVADNNIFYPSLPRPIYAVGGYAYVADTENACPSGRRGRTSIVPRDSRPTALSFTAAPRARA